MADLEPAGEPVELRGATSHHRLLKNPPPGLAPLQEAWWSCGIDYPHLASGAVDYLVYKNDWPWDHLPGSLLVAEVGGKIGRLDGAPYRLDTRRPWVLTTGDPRVHAAVGEAVASVLR